MIRLIIAIVVGYILWSVMWLAGNAMLFGETAEVIGQGERFSDAGPLLGVLALSVVCSLAAGIVTAAIARERATRGLTVVAVLLLLTGIGVQMGMWALMPVWYHLTFLALLVPVVLLGGRFAGGRAKLSS